MARRRHFDAHWTAKACRGATVVAAVAMTASAALAQQAPPPATVANPADADFGLRRGAGTQGDAAQTERRPAGGTAGAASVPADATINYGKPRARHPLPRGFPPQAPAKNTLPPLEPYKGAIESRVDPRRIAPPPPVYNPDAEIPRIPPPPTVAALPTLPTRPRPRVDSDPYAPVGIGIGNLRLRPYIESDVGFDTNPNRVTSPQKGSAFVRGEGGLSLQSDWSQHSLVGSLRAGYYDFFSVPAANRPDGAGSVAGRIDVTRDTSIDVGGAFSLDTLRPGSPELIGLGTSAISTNRPIITTFGGYTGVTQRFNRLEVSLRGSVDRSLFGDANFSDGSKQYLSLNDFTTIGLRPRLSYEVSPGFRPFVEATVDKRAYDNTLDVNGYRRSSNGITARAGAAFDVSRGYVTGEVSGGFIQRDYDDPRLQTLRGPAIDAALIWTATPLTTVTLRGTTGVAETTIAGVSGALTRGVTGEISHALLRNVTLVGSAGFQLADYRGVDPTIAPTGSINERFVTAGARAEYNLTRTVVIKASYNYERLKSTVTGSDYTANVFLLGLRLQR